MRCNWISYFQIYYKNGLQQLILPMNWDLKLKIKYWVCLSLLGISMNSFGQDPLFSQYYAQALHINPGFAGISYAPRFELIYRNQWPLIQNSAGGYVTYAVSYDQFFKNINSGIGFQLLADDAGGGLLKTLKAAATYGYQAQISDDNYLRGGIEVGFVQTNYAWDKFIFGDQLDPEFGSVSPGGTPYSSEEIRPDKTQASYLDIGTGLVYYNPYFNIGISAKHVNTPQNDILKINPTTYSGIPVRWVIHGSAQIDFGSFGKQLSILSPSILLAKQAEFFQLNIGAQYQFSTVFAGLWYRQAKKNPDALIGLVGFKKGVWKFGYSYDYTLSSLGNGTGGSHELSLGIFLGEIWKEKKNINDCFDAFR